MRLIPRLLLSLLALLPLALSAAPAATDLQEGRDYERIAQPGPFQPLAGRIEVVEVFGYTCSHCAHFEPQLVAWVAKLPKDVRFTPFRPPSAGRGMRGPPPTTPPTSWASPSAATARCSRPCTKIAACRCRTYRPMNWRPSTSNTA